MNVSINLTPALETALKRQAADAGQDLESFVQRVVEERIIDGVETPSPRRTIPPEEFAAYIRDTVARHGISVGISVGNVDDSRESIYEGRGE